MIIQQEKFKEIADEIRMYTGSSDLIKPSEFAGKIQDVFEEGRNFGAEERDDLFWETLQDGGKRTNYQYMFNTGWNQYTFKPKYDMVLIGLGANNMFGGSGASSTNRGLDLRKSALGITIDFSGCTSFNGAFAYTYNSSVVAIGIIDTRNAPSLANLLTAMNALHTVEKVILKDDGSQTSMNMSNAKALANIAFEGVIGCDINFKDSPLTYASMVSVITHLKNYSGTDKEYAYTLSLNESASAVLLASGTPSSEGIDFEGSWLEYVDSLGWNY